MKHYQQILRIFFGLSIAFAAIVLCSFVQSKSKASNTSYTDLVSLFKEFDQLRHPKIIGGKPDYSAGAMLKQLDSLRILQARLTGMDTTGWTKDQQIDYRLVEANMHCFEFNHTVMHRWSSDPAFYATTGGFYWTMEAAFGLPGLPMDEKEIKSFKKQLEIMPEILADAKNNLTNMTPDLALLGIKRKVWEENQYKIWLPQLARYHPGLVKSANKVVAAIVDFRQWLEAKLPALKGSSGIGVDNYNWLLKNVYLSPYTWEECVLLTQRELERTLADLKMEESRNRNLPQLPLIVSRRQQDSIYLSSQEWLIKFIRDNRILPQPDYLKTTGSSNYGSGSVIRPTGRNFFENVLDRDPLPLLPHDMVGHSPDAAREKEWNNRLIPRAWDPFYTSGQRVEALATDMEENLMTLGMLDQKPRSRELTLMLRIFRAVRALEDLKMHSNEFTLQQGIDYAMKTVPYGWYNMNTDLIWEEADLYLRVPGYGAGYLMGSVELERLIAKRAMVLGTSFDFMQFMKDFFDPGLIPISLIDMNME